MTRTTNHREGFTLIEIVLVVAMTAGIVFVVASFRSNLDMMENLLNQKLQSRQDIDQALQIMTTEIRSAGPSSLGAYAIQAAGTSSLVFFSDVDKDGVYERVRYFVATSTGATTTINRGIVKPAGNPLVYTTSSETVTTAIVNVIRSTTTPLFSYFDTNYTGFETPLALPVDATLIRLVKVSLYADINPSTAPIPTLFSTMINIRNLRTN
jgi:type II secretory pathway pseudopilin PulG